MKIQTEAPPARRTCAACELLLPPVADAAPLCAYCAEEPETACRRIVARADAARAGEKAAWLTLNRAVDALPSDLAPRWERMREALEAKQLGTADEPTVARLREARAALDRGALPPLANVWAAYEAHWWARADAERRIERAQRKLEEVEAWLAARAVTLEAA